MLIADPWGQKEMGEGKSFEVGLQGEETTGTSVSLGGMDKAWGMNCKQDSHRITHGK